MEEKLQFLPNTLSVDQIADMARNAFSAFDGYQGRSSFDGYLGVGDAFVDYQGEGRNFASVGGDMQFVMTVKNGGAAARRILLVPGMDYIPLSRMVLSAGTGVTYPKKGVLTDTATTEQGVAFTMTNFLDLDGAAFAVGDYFIGSPKSLDMFYKWISENPTSLYAIRVSSTDSNQVMQTITYRKQSPFKDLETRIINLGQQQTEDTYRDKLVTVMTPNMVLSNQTQLEMSIVAASTCTVTFFCNGSLNQSKLMQEKVNAASTTMATQYVAGAVKKDDLNAKNTQ